MHCISGGFRGDSLEPPLCLNYFIFMENFQKNEQKVILTNQTPLVNLNLLSRNLVSTPVHEHEGKKVSQERNSNSVFSIIRDIKGLSF